MTTSDTPRTNKQEWNEGTKDYPYLLVESEFARQLERELNAANLALNKAVEVIEQLNKQIGTKHE